MRSRFATDPDAVATLAISHGAGRAARAQSAGGAFVNFESGHVRPLALSPDGSRLFAVNTPDNRLAIYTRRRRRPDARRPRCRSASSRSRSRARTQHRGLGGEPPLRQREHRRRSTRRRRRCRASPARCSPATSRATSSSPGRATTAPSSPRRGAGRTAPVAANLTTAGHGARRRAGLRRHQPRRGARRHADREHRQLFARHAARAGAHARTGRGSSPRRSSPATARRRSSSRTVSGNGGLPPPPAGVDRPARRRPASSSSSTAATGWTRSTGSWNGQVPFNLPDRDVFIIDANANPPALVSGTSNVVGVGTVLFNMAVRPNAANQLYVANTDARNQVRFEPRIVGDRSAAACRATSPRAASRSSTAPRRRPHHLNPHIDYLCTPPGCVPPASRARGRAWRSRRTWCSRATASALYVAGFGSGKVGIFDAAALEAGTINATHEDAGRGRRRPERPRARRGAQPALRHEPLHARHLDREQRQQPGDAPIETAVVPLRFDPEPADRARRPAVPLRRARHVGARRLRLRELPHLRRLRQPGVGPGRPVRRGRAERQSVPRDARLGRQLGGAGVGIACPTATSTR